jgi:hypothetical protein
MTASTFFSRRQNNLSLPLDSSWTSEDNYVDSLLTFATTSTLFRNLCGGVHILDFLTREPDLYSTVLPQEWRDLFERVEDVQDILDLLMRHDLDDLEAVRQKFGRDVPGSLVEYIRTIRRHTLRRNFQPVSESVTPLPAHVAVGMKTKKIHEVTHFAQYISELSDHITISSTAANNNGDQQRPPSMIDFGSGQNYLGRTLASPPYNRHVIAIEKRHHNVVGARGMDVHAKLATKEKIMRNKKIWKKAWEARKSGILMPSTGDGEEMNGQVEKEEEQETPDPSMAEAKIVGIEFSEDEGRGSMTYIEHDIQDGDLSSILYPPLTSQATSHSSASQTSPQPSTPSQPSQSSIVISLHSCGNLSHHALRTLPSNPSITAVAVIGCCYNLLTERLGPATYKHPQLRPNHPRLIATGSTYDPHGFPMSRRLENFEFESENEYEKTGKERGVRLNITARMMAVQAPFNWTSDESEMFFRRHFYRALLQKILLDVGVVKQIDDPGLAGTHSAAGGSVTGRDDQGTPLIIGSLPKHAFQDFQTYVHAALKKLSNDSSDGPNIAPILPRITHDLITSYESNFNYALKHLSIIWSLMAFSAGIVESIIVTDRWLYLREQKCVGDAWVDVAFESKLSPRCFVVCGVRKRVGWDEEGGG